MIGASNILQAPRLTDRPTRATARRTARLRSADGLAGVVILLYSASIGDEANGAAVVAARLDAARYAVDAVDAAEQVGLRIGRVGEAVIRARQVLLRHRADDVGRH